MDKNQKNSKIKQYFIAKREKRVEKERQRDFIRYGLTKEDTEEKNIYNLSSQKHDYKALFKCFVYMKSYKKYIIFGFICALLVSALAFCTPIFTQRIIDYLGVEEYILAIYMAIGYVAFQLLRHFVNYLWGLSTTIGFQKTVRDLRQDLVDKLALTKISKFDTANSGSIITRVTSDSASIVDIAFDAMGKFCEFVIGLGFLIYIFTINVWIGIAMVFVTLLTMWVGHFYQRFSYKNHKKSRILYDKRTGFVNEFVRGIRDIKNLNIKNNVKQEYLRNVDNVAKLEIDRAKKGDFLSRLRWIVVALGELIYLVLGIYLISINQFTLGGLVVILVYGTRANGIIESIQFMLERLRNASVSAGRVYEILNDKDFPKEKFGTKTIKEPKGKIEFNNVSFGYKDENVIKDMSFDINPNQSVAFVGKSGQGKSTLLSLIPKLYDVSSGTITIDGVNINELSENGLRNLVAMVPQTPYIFNATIRQNLEFVKPDLSEGEMIEVCKEAQIHDFIMSKEKGYDSLLGENGVILSGGQRQRLAIARALLKRSKIILFDEATSALDNENQSKIQKIIENLTKDHTIIVVAHRLSTIVNCDKIYMIENGKIIAQGTHHELMTNCKEYKNLYKIEQKNAEND